MIELDDAAVVLPAEAASVARARRHVTSVLEEAGADEDTVGVAQLLVSEIVTNALLHAGTEIELRCVVDDDCARVDVRDRSLNRPAIRRYDATATTGRGLGLVDALATRWGVQDHDDGKVVWFELGEGTDEPVVVDAVRHQDPPLTIHFRNLPVEMVRTTIEYSEASLRELALMALEEDREWSPPALDLGPLLDQLDSAAIEPPHVDLTIDFPSGSDRAALGRLALVDHSDALARAGKTLSPPALPEITHCRKWLYRQIGLQPEGLQPEPWAMPDPLAPALPPPDLDPDELRALAPPLATVVVADDANRIVHVTDSAAALVGWSPDELVGRRLVVLVPPALRAAHLAGFAHHQLTGEERLVGGDVVVPALRRDGTTVAVHLQLAKVAVGGGRTVFTATLRPAEDDATG